MRRALIFVLLMLPIVANAQRVTTRAISLGTTAIPPLGLFAQAEYEWQASSFAGLTAGAAYSLRTVGLGTTTADFTGEEYKTYSRLSALDLSFGASFHVFQATAIYPYLTTGVSIVTRLAQVHIRELNPVDVDPIFPMLCLGVGLRQPITGANYIGLGARVQVSPTAKNSRASTAIAALEWVATL